MLYFTYSFIRDHINIDNYYWFLFACYYSNNITELEDFDLDNILIDKKSHENSSVYNISNKTIIDSKPLRIRFFQIDGIIRIYDGTRYLTLFGSE